MAAQRFKPDYDAGMDAYAKSESKETDVQRGDVSTECESILTEIQKRLITEKVFTMENADPQIKTDSQNYNPLKTLLEFITTDVRYIQTLYEKKVQTPTLEKHAKIESAIPQL